MKGFWLLHLTGALVFAGLLALYTLPDESLPPNLTGPRNDVRDGLTTGLAPWVAARGTSPSEESAELMRQMIREKYEDSLAQLELKRDRLQKQLREKEKSG